jgi:hypothetical protein
MLFGVEWARTAEHGAVPAESPRTPQNIERALEGCRARAVIDDMHTLAIGQAQCLLREATLGIDDDMIRTRFPGDRDLVGRGDATDDLSAAQLDDLRQQ